MGKLHWKISAAFLLLTTIVLVIAGIVIGSQFSRYYKEEQKRVLATRLDVVWLFLSRRQVADGTDLHDLIRRAAEVTLTRITLIDSLGRVVTDSDVPVDALDALESHADRREIGMASERGIGSDVRTSSTLGEELMYVAKRVVTSPADGALAGVRYLRMSVRLKEINEHVKAIRWYILFAGTGVLISVFLLSLFISRRISEPIVRVAETVEEIRSGNLDATVEARGSEEIVRVAEAVEGMRETLKADLTQLRKLERVRTEFLGNVSHELRTPIFSLQGFLETLIDGAIDDPKVNRAFLEKAFHHASRLQTLLDELMTISQIESGEMKMSFRYFPITDLASTLVQDFQSLAAHYTVQLLLVPEIPEGVPVLGDKERIRVVLENLIENGIKYNNPGGEVRVVINQESSHVRVSVKDSGIGISPEHLPRVFERFYRADRDRSREVGGTGLGLAICKHIIEAHSSKIEVESVVGKGSSFTFALRM